MSASYVARLLSNATTAEKILADLKLMLEEVKQIKIATKIKEIQAENKKLTENVNLAKAELIRLETLHGKIQYSIPCNSIAKAVVVKNEVKENTVTEKEIKENAVLKEKKNLDKKSKDKPKLISNDDNSVVDVRKLDFRIGKIVEVNKHPDADSLYVEKIDCGEPNLRTVVSGLVKHVPIEQMQDRLVVILSNLKPAKMRGITSEAMVMCASTPEKVEILVPPADSVPGDLVTCEGYPREPELILNPKKKIFETCAPDLKTNENGVACYKGSPLTVENKGPIIAPTLKDVNVK